MSPDALPLPWLLGAVRLWAMLRVQPTWRLLVGPWWEAVAAGLGAVLALGLPGPEASASWVAVGALVAIELGVGTVIGLLASLPAYGLLGAAGGAAMVTGALPKPMLALSAAIVCATGLALGIHQPLIAAARETVALVPLGDPLAASLSAATIAGAAHTMLLLALALITPALLAGVVMELAARIVGRGPGAASAVADVAPWLRMAAALVGLGASWSAYSEAWVATLLPAGS